MFIWWWQLWFDVHILTPWTNSLLLQTLFSFQKLLDLIILKTGMWSSFKKCQCTALDLVTSILSLGRTYSIISSMSFRLLHQHQMLHQNYWELALCMFLILLSKRCALKRWRQLDDNFSKLLPTCFAALPAFTSQLQIWQYPRWQLSHPL
jgi:tRNA(Met) C34 N-acetyltransferase TmcA